MTEQSTEQHQEQLFEGMTLEASNALQTYIEADTPPHYIPQNYRRTYVGSAWYESVDAIDKPMLWGVAIGTSLAGVALVDYVATASDRAGLNVEEHREAASEEMNFWLEDIKDDLTRHPNEVIVPRGSTREVYDVSAQEGLARYIQDEISDSTLEAEQKEALSEAIDTSDGQRLEETDEQQIEALQEAADTAAASYPDREAAITNANTGELLLGGSLIILASIAVRSILSHRQNRQIKAYRAARGSLAVEKKNLRAEYQDNPEEYAIFVEAAQAIGYEDFSRLRGERPTQPRGGGEKTRTAMFKIVKRVINQNQEEANAA